MDSGGLVDVTVAYSHISSLGMGCGIDPDLVSKTLSEDNAQRKSHNDMVLDSYPLEGPNLDFSLGSDEESGSDSEMLEVL